MFSPPFWGDIGRPNAYPKKRKFPRTEIPGNNPSTTITYLLASYLLDNSNKYEYSNNRNGYCCEQAHGRPGHYILTHSL